MAVHLSIFAFTRTQYTAYLFRYWAGLVYQTARRAIFPQAQNTFYTALANALLAQAGRTRLILAHGAHRSWL